VSTTHEPCANRGMSTSIFASKPSDSADRLFLSCHYFNPSPQNKDEELTARAKVSSEVLQLWCIIITDVSCLLLSHF
jgi:hypothetical protein